MRRVRVRLNRTPEQDEQQPEQAAMPVHRMSNKKLKQALYKLNQPFTTRDEAIRILSK